MGRGEMRRVLGCGWEGLADGGAGLKGHVISTYPTLAHVRGLIGMHLWACLSGVSSSKESSALRLGLCGCLLASRPSLLLTKVLGPVNEAKVLTQRQRPSDQF